jgi:hypothetical protein
MATIEITTQSGAVGNGDLQLQNGAPMDATLRFVTDAINTASPLKLSTSLVQTTSTLQITTNDNPYIDAEDGTGNNRFTVGRAPASQQVNVDFASNPAGSTTAVGAIRTYRDGTNLSEAMTFIEDGSVGIGTNTPTATLNIKATGSNNSDNLAQVLTNSELRLQYRADDLSSLYIGGLGSERGYLQGINNTQNAGADISLNPYGGNIGIGTTSPTRTLHVLGQSGIGTVLKLEGAPSTTTYLQLAYNGATNAQSGYISYDPSANMGLFTNDTERMRITSAGNVGIGTSTPDAYATRYLQIHATSGNSALRLSNATSGTTKDDGADVEFKGDHLFISVRETGGYIVFAPEAVERMRITSAGNVGIGTSTPTTKLTIDNSATTTTKAIDLVGNTSSCKGHLGLFADAVYLTSNYFYDGSQNNDNAGLGQTAIIMQSASLSASSISFNTAAAGATSPTKRASIDADGLKFGSDTAAANALDDYEEGTFTATITPSTSGTITLSPSTCSYTKIGRQVTIRGQVVVSAISSPVGGTLILGGLPFTSQNSVSSRGAGVFQYFPSVGSGSLLQNIQLQNSVEVNLILDASTIAAGAEFYISLTYFA